MKVTRKTTIVEISKEDLVNLFSTALYGSECFYGEYDKKFYESLPSERKSEDDCLEDKMADCLLNFGDIYITDTYAEGEVCGNKERAVKVEEDGDVTYALNYSEIVIGLEKCANSEEGYIRRAFEEFADEDGMDFDAVSADTLMQVILFGELVYG